MNRIEALASFHISGTSLAAMIIVCIVAFLIPLCTFIFFKKKNPGAKKMNALVGAMVFIIFALVLERLLNIVMFNTFGQTILSNLFAYAAYGGLAAGIFEETGRFLAMKYLMKNSLDKQNAIMYGIGHGGIESIIIVGITYLSLIIVAIHLNNAPVEKITVLMAKNPTLFQQMKAMAAAPAFSLCLVGIERIIAFAFQISLSYLVYKSVAEKKIRLFIAAIGLHFFVDASAFIMSKKLSVYITELYLLSVVFVVSFFIFKSYIKDQRETASGQ